jgi:hypothetical protein
MGEGLSSRDQWSGLQVTQSSEGWYIGQPFGATCHMTREEDAFQEFSAQASGFMRCGIHISMATVRGEGTVILQIESGRL